MRRFDDVRSIRKPGASPPFRVLTTRDTSYLGSSSSSSSITAHPPPRSPGIQLPAHPPAPPPPPAPDPYKLVPAGTALGRAHRRSSFVIIAESRPTTPELRSVSPTQPTGRVSPFRGRGFKGPPPKSRSPSRPDSPDDYLDERKSQRRTVRTNSRVSQQNSPRKSLIPQPTRRRSVSLSKSTDEKLSPKIGRRVDSRNRLTVHGSIDNVNDARRSSIVNDISRFRRDRLPRTPSKLSPIQGTPTKVDKLGARPSTRDRADSKNPKNLQRNTITGTPGSRFISPPKNNQNRERFINTDDSPVSSKTSKIPLKSNGSKVSSSASMPDMSKNDQVGGNNKIESNKTGQTEKRNNADYKRNNEKDQSGSGSSSNEIGLTDLLKRTSGVTGTSSVVNTTTTTAVQPLRIDNPNARIPIDSAKNEEQSSESKKPGNETFGSKSDTNGKSRTQNSQNEDKNAKKRNGQGYDTPTKTNNERYSSMNREAASDSPANSSNATKSRLSSAHHRNADRRAYDRATSRERLDEKGTSSASSKSSGPRNSKNPKTSKRSTFDELSPVSNTSTMDDGTKQMEIEQVEFDKIVYDGKSITSSDVIVTTGKISGNVNNVMNNDGNSSLRSNKLTGNRIITEAAVESESMKNSDQKQGNGSERIIGTISSKTSNANNERTNISTVSRTNGISVNSIVDPTTGANVPSKASLRRHNENHDRNTPPRSLTRLSSGSNDSDRSTDTGVSVDTVKGVSSPRVKRGMHVVKRPDEIETLSGNVMRPEQNGDPTALQTAGEPNTDEEDRRSTDKPLSRWRRTLGRYYERFPTMKCLACRRHSKILSWSRKRDNVAMRNETDPRQGNTNEISSDCWSRFKKRCCRCPRLKGVRCCARRDRVAPDEPKLCCPPERRLSALCRRLFASCKCKCTDQQRTRDIRAKHSLTSVAPPPLSEEPKAKIPDVLVEHNSLMRGAIPCLPVPLAWFCLVWNVLLPGSGTVWSGLFNLCTGQPRFSAVAGLKARFGAFIVNLIVGVGQLFTVLFCLVGWGWSVWWGVMMVRLARKYKRFKASEAANGDPEARTGDASALPPGVPSQSLRGVERAR